MWYSQYRGKSIGRILEWLENICGYNVSSRITVGGGEVHLYNKQIASYEWRTNGNYDYPVFTFVGENADSYEKRQEEILCLYKLGDRVRFAIDDYGAELEHKIKERNKLLKRAKDVLSSVSFNIRVIDDEGGNAYFKVLCLKSDIEKLIEEPDAIQDNQSE